MPSISTSGGTLLRSGVKPSLAEAISREASQIHFAQFTGGLASWLATRLYQEFQSRDDSARLSIEGLALELIAEVSKSEQQLIDKRPPAWLNRAKDLLHARSGGQLTNEAVEKGVGVHPTHLARVPTAFALHNW
jgi:hypothetical protein